MAVEVIRLTPTMASRKNQILAFVRSYFAEHGESPSITEIARAANCARSRVQEAIRKLEREQKINRTPNKARSIIPISGHEEAIRQLEAAGFIVNPSTIEALPQAPLIDLDERGRLKVG